MANCNDLFQEFYKRITPSKTQISQLRQARDAIRKRIKNYFKNTLKKKEPLFYQQGSFALKTIIIPLDGEYDIDDGLYLQNLDNNKEKWVKTETVHLWVMEAVSGHTNEKPKDKNKCVRVIYAGNYHVDIPIYGKSNGKFYLAVKGEPQWQESDPKLFSDWFKGRVKFYGEDDQLRRIIIYLKAWKDYNDIDFKGIMITIMVGENFIPVENRDDESLVKTLGEIINYLKVNRSIINPIDSSENLLANWKDEKINKLIFNLEKLLESGVEALNLEDKEEATEIWQDVFGDRFPDYNNEKNFSPCHTSSPINIKSTPKPWGNNGMVQ